MHPNQMHLSRYCNYNCACTAGSCQWLWAHTQCNRIIKEAPLRPPETHESYSGCGGSTAQLWGNLHANARTCALYEHTSLDMGIMCKTCSCIIRTMLDRTAATTSGRTDQTVQPLQAAWAVWTAWTGWAGAREAIQPTSPGVMTLRGTLFDNF